MKIMVFPFLFPFFLLSQNDTILRHFRSTTINDQKITLGSSITTLSKIITKNKLNNYHLKKGTFQVADSIWLETNNTAKIISISFSYNYEPEYSNDTAYIHEQRKFQRIIASTGKEFIYKGPQISVRVNKWENQNIVFELCEMIENGKKIIFSVIFEKELFSKYYLVDKEIVNKSIILWKKLNT